MYICTKNVISWPIYLVKFFPLSFQDQFGGLKIPIRTLHSRNPSILPGGGCGYLFDIGIISCRRICRWALQYMATRSVKDDKYVYQPALSRNHSKESVFTGRDRTSAPLCREIHRLIWQSFKSSVVEEVCHCVRGFAEKVRITFTLRLMAMRVNLSRDSITTRCLVWHKNMPLDEPVLIKLRPGVFIYMVGIVTVSLEIVA